MRKTRISKEDKKTQKKKKIHLKFLDKQFRKFPPYSHPIAKTNTRNISSHLQLCIDASILEED